MARDVVGPLNSLMIVVVSVEDSLDGLHRLVAALVDSLRFRVLRLDLVCLQLGGFELVFCDEVGVLGRETHAGLISPEDDRVPCRLDAEPIFSPADGYDVVVCAETDSKGIHYGQGRSEEQPTPALRRVALALVPEKQGQIDSVSGNILGDEVRDTHIGSQLVVEHARANTDRRKRVEEDDRDGMPC